MAINVYYRQVLIGGGATALDAVDGAVLNNGDAAFVFDGTNVYEYFLNATSGAAESSPDVISPDINAGTKRWILQVSYNAPSTDGQFQSIQIFTASGTYTKPAGLVRAETIVIGGGGGGGGGSNNNGADGAGAGGGGGSSIELIETASMGATEAVTIGAGGAGGSGASNGSAGGTTSFGSLLSATGGSGGDAASGTDNTGGTVAGGLGSGGDINLGGGAGAMGGGGSGGNGGSTYLGGGGAGGNFEANGSNGGNYGCGGGGAGHAGASVKVGGAGISGIILVREYF